MKIKKLLITVVLSVAVLTAALAAPLSAGAYDVVNLPDTMTLADAIGVFSYDNITGMTVTSYEDNKYVTLSEQEAKDFYYEFANITLERKIYMTPFRGTAVTIETSDGSKYTVNLLAGVQIGTFGSGYVCYQPSKSDADALMKYYSVYHDSDNKTEGRDTVIQGTSFLKLPSDEWAVEPVTLAAEKGLLTYELTSKYSAAISREQFCDLIAQFICVQGNYASLEGYMKDTNTAYVIGGYTDCAGRSENIDMLSALGIVSGRGDGTFAPGEPITRQEAAKMLCETAALFTYISTYGSLSFTDNVYIADWAEFYVTWVSEQWIMNGMTDGSFMPLDWYTVQQAVTTVNRLYTVVNK